METDQSHVKRKSFYYHNKRKQACQVHVALLLFVGFKVVFHVVVNGAATNKTINV